MANNYANSSQPNMSTWMTQFGAPHRLPNGSKWSNADQTRCIAKVGKVSSGHKSPRGIERRRTTTSVRPYSMEQHYHPKLDEQVSRDLSGNELQRLKMARPVSWHPSSHLGAVPEYGNLSTAEQHQAAFSAPNFDVSSHETFYHPTSYFAITTHQNETSFMDFNMMNSVICELGHNSASTFCPPASNLQFVQPQSYFPPVSSNGIPLSDGIVPSGHQDLSYTFSIPHNTSAVNTGSYNTAQFLQQIEPSYAAPPNPSEPDKELVGMGLYDAPENVTATGSQFGGNRFSMMSDATHSDGKGLKLEETWQPPGEQGVDDEAGDDESSEEDLDEISPLVPQPTFVHGMQYDVPVDLSGQSFFFEDEAAVGNEWWYDQLKQPTAHNAGIGYGWLYNPEQV